MKRLLISGVMGILCWIIPCTASASQYIGDYCFLMNNQGLMVFTVSYVGTDSSGYETYTYTGRIPELGSAINGECVEYRSGGRQYICNVANTWMTGFGQYHMALDYYTLNGVIWGIEINYDTSSQTFDDVYFQYPITSVNCPASW